MKKWMGVLISLFLIVVFLMFFGSSSYRIRSSERETEGTKARQTIVAERGELEKGREGSDPHLIQILKMFREKLDGWLRSLDERIESEDITRIEVRFLEILRNMLAWMKEKIEAKIASSEQRPLNKKERGLFRETRLENSVAPACAEASAGRQSAKGVG